MKRICRINGTTVFLLNVSLLLYSGLGRVQSLAGQDFALSQMTDMLVCGLDSKYKNILQVNQMIIFGA